MKFKCTYCNRVMQVTLLEYKQNNTCNSCFNERAAEFVKKNRINTKVFEYHGLSIKLNDDHDTIEPRLNGH